MEKWLMRNRYNFLIHWFVFFVTLASCLVFYFITSVSIQSPTLSSGNIAFSLHNFSKSSLASPIGYNFTAKTNNSSSNNKNEPVNISVVHKDSTNCSGKYIYVYNLPPEFNDGLLKDCGSVSRWSDFCPYLSNKGFGPRVKSNSSREVFGSNRGWFKTNQFSLEVIFHERMKRYECLTNDSSRASAIFVPYYAGIDVGRLLWGFNTSVRDELAKRLVGWLGRRPEWKRMFGRDHFFVGGRVAWDFRRRTEDESDWGSKLMFLPESQNMTMLTIETSSSRNEFAVPYPTYFHPSSQKEVVEWQERMRRTNRPHLFSFAGAPRPGSPGSIRGELFEQCRSSGKLCRLLGCYAGVSNCDEPANVMRAFERSAFCLQPSGDSFTRRSTFDSILAGCVPVFFDPDSGYNQYLWHFPKNHTKYSVFIPESDVRERRVNIGETLQRIPGEEVLAMREEVIEMIPRIIYADPIISGLERFEDAFDIAVKNMLQRVDKVREAVMDEGNDPSFAFA